jgi:hypothetical protein
MMPSSLRNLLLAQWLSLLGIIWCLYDPSSVEQNHGTKEQENKSMLIDQPSSLAAAEKVSGPSYKVAYDQSLGFFDDISDENWKRAQTIHTKMFPNHYTKMSLFQNSNSPNDKGNYEKLKRSQNWNGNNFQEEFHCGLAQRIETSNAADGPKWVCDPHRIAKKKDCLVYSVGSNGKAEFEQGIKEEIGEHCEIHTFDVSDSNKRFGKFASVLEPYSTFHHWGIGTEEEAATKKKRFKTLEQTMKDLGHTGRRVDILKIDCEWCEWFTYKQWLKADLRQILVETHNAPMPNARDFFYDLHDAGYVIFSKEANYVNRAGGVEFGFLKLSTDFFVNNTMYKNMKIPENEVVKKNLRSITSTVVL